MASRGTETRGEGKVNVGVWGGGGRGVVEPPHPYPPFPLHLPPSPPPPSSSSLLSCFLNACQESLMAVEFGQEKSGAGSFRGSGDLCLTKAAPLFVFSQAEAEGERTRAGAGGRASASVSNQRCRPLGGLRGVGGDLRHMHDHA